MATCDTLLIRNNITNMNKNGTIDQDTHYYTVVSETYLSMHGVTLSLTL